MRASGTLLRLARALVDNPPSTAACVRAVCPEKLSRLPSSASAACSGAARAFAGAAPASDHATDGDAEQQRQEWELGSPRTSHTLVTNRQRTLEDFEQLIGVLIRRRRLVGDMPFRCISTIRVAAWASRHFVHT